MKAKVYGLTGPTGAGKSHVALKLAEQGFEIIDADAVAHEVTAPDSRCLQQLVNAFGEDILSRDKTLDRTRLAQVAFSSRQATERLNQITHPEIMRLIQEKIDFCMAEGKSVVIDAPLLFEAGADAVCHRTIAVTAPSLVRMRRIMQRDGISEEQALMRMEAQRPDSFYTNRADYTVINSGTLEDFEKKIAQLVEELLYETP